MSLCNAWVSFLWGSDSGVVHFRLSAGTDWVMGAHQGLYHHSDHLHLIY